MNTLVAASAFLLSRSLLKASDRVELLIGCFIVYFSQIVFTEMVLGIFGALKLNNIILLNCALFLAIYLLTGRNNSARYFKDVLPALPKDKIYIFILAVIISFAAVKGFINLANPPFGWDSLNYHFTFSVEWLKHANLNTPITISDDPSPSYYPIGGSLFYLWLIFPLRNVFLADLGQLPFFILAILCIYKISRRLGLSKELSFYASALFLLIPNFFKQLSIAYVDVMVAALFLSSLSFLFLIKKKFSWQNVLFFSLSLGLLLGVKTLSLPYSVLLFIPFIWFCLRENSLRGVVLFCLSLFIISALGGFSYVRNFIEAGNPLYPFNLTISGKEIFKGVMDKSIYAAHFTKSDYNLGKLLFHEGLGAQSLIFVMPAVFLGLSIAAVKNRKGLNFNLAYFLLLPLLLYLVYRFIIPLANTRYLYPLLAIGIISAFYTYASLKIPLKIFRLIVVICILASIFELAKRQELIISLILVPLFFYLLLKTKQWAKFLLKPYVWAIFLILSIFSLTFLERWYVKNEFHRYGLMVKYSGFWPEAASAWVWLNSNTKGENIAYVGRPVAFPLYGSNLKNNVYYVSLNKTEPAKLHYFPKSRYQWGMDYSSQHKNFEAPGNYRCCADYSLWLGNLARRKTDYLFVYSLHQTKELEFPVEDTWALSHPERFTPVFTNKTIHIYRLVNV